MSANRLGWHHLCVEIPDEWEVIEYGTRQKDGSLRLSDPEGETLQVHWNTLKRAPNMRNRLQTWLAKYSPGEDARFREVEAWSLCAVKGGPLVAVRHDAEVRVLLTLVFSAHARENVGDAAIAAILNSYTQNRGERRVWAAFGIDVMLPEPGSWTPWKRCLRPSGCIFAAGTGSGYRSIGMECCRWCWPVTPTRLFLHGSKGGARWFASKDPGAAGWRFRIGGRKTG